MISCVRCGQENAADAKTCTQCGYALDPEAFTPPQLLAQIQGLIPAEPIISTGRLRQGQAPPVDLPVSEPEEKTIPAAASAAAFAAAGMAVEDETETEIVAEVASEMEPEAGEAEPEAVFAPEPVEAPTSEPEIVAESERLAESERFAEPEPEVEPEAGETEPEVEPEIEPQPEPVQSEERVAEPAPESEPEEDDLIGAEPPDVPVPAPSLHSPWILAGFAAFLLVILLGIRLPGPAVINAPRRPAVEVAYTFIEILPPNAHVLLAWDYEPTTQGEMQLLANPILLHLRQKRARIANLSLRPTGPAVAADAEALVDYFDSSLLPQPPSTELGFIPGDAAALRSLSMSPAGAASLSERQIESADLDAQDDVETFDLIIEFSAETAATQEWVEQIATRQETPLIVAASGAVAPVLRPYEQSGQIAALLSGYADALAYERLTGVDGPAVAQRNPQSAAHLLLIAVILFALIRSLFRRSPSASRKAPLSP